MDPRSTTSSSRGPIRMAAKSWAITSWTHVCSTSIIVFFCCLLIHDSILNIPLLFLFLSFSVEEIVLNEIKRQFGLDHLQYACVVQEMKPPDMTPHIHIQIILKVKTNERRWFLDDITGLFFFSHKNMNHQ